MRRGLASWRDRPCRAPALRCSRAHRPYIRGRCNIRVVAHVDLASGRSSTQRTSIGTVVNARLPSSGCVIVRLGLIPAHVAGIAASPPSPPLPPHAAINSATVVAAPGAWAPCWSSPTRPRWRLRDRPLTTIMSTGTSGAKRTGYARARGKVRVGESKQPLTACFNRVCRRQRQDLVVEAAPPAPRRARAHARSPRGRAGRGSAVRSSSRRSTCAPRKTALERAHGRAHERRPARRDLRHVLHRQIAVDSPRGGAKSVLAQDLQRSASSGARRRRAQVVIFLAAASGTELEMPGHGKTNR